MKAISAGMTTHLGLTTTSLATIWRIIRRDGQNFYFTDLDVDFDFDDGDGVATYKSTSSFNKTAISNSTTLSVDNLDIEGVFNPADVSENDFLAHRFDFAKMRIGVVNFKNLADGFIRQKNGFLGEAVFTPSGIYRTEFRSLSQPLNQTLLENYGPECRADLGDGDCLFPLFPNVLGRSQIVSAGEFYRVNTAGGNFQNAYENRIYEVTVGGTTAASQPAYDTTIDAVNSDGTASLTTRDAIMRHAVVASVTDRRVFTITVDESRAVDDWFNHGVVVFEEGDNLNVAREILDWSQSSTQITLFLPMPFVPIVGQRLRLHAGCDRRLATCRDRFANVINFQGEPHVPGPDSTLKAE